MAVDLSVFDRLKTKADYDRAEEEFQLKRKLANAEAMKANQLDIDKMGEIAFWKAAQGAELSPQERAAAQYVDAKSGGIQFDPVNGGMIQKPRISDKIGIPGLQPSQPSAPQIGGFSTPETPQYNDEIEQNFQVQMQAAEGNRKLQQQIEEEYRKSRLEQTGEQAKAGGFADRMAAADPIIQEKEKVGTSLYQNMAGAVPLVGNYMVSEDYQQLDQAKRDFINSVLRRESGAVISPSEFDNANKQYFPRPGDSDAVLKQKAANRQTALSGIERSAGPAYKTPTAPSTRIKIIHPQTGEMLEIPEDDFPAARAEGFMRR